ncbi:MAG TPA: XdhC/CoxI family protein [Aggregatilineaceae bacterium]|nr:XdhC/CoxI family protein [Aggregatilineaceae bacterium]
MADDLLTQAAEWLDAGDPVAMATIVRVFGSSSQPLGARMIMTTANRFVGAVSGGCVETDVYETAQEVLRSGNPLMLHYKHVENPLVEIGLNCEGKIDVLVERLDRDLLDTLMQPPGRHVNVTLCSPAQPTAPDVFHLQISRNGAPDIASTILRDARVAMKDDKPLSVTYAGGQVALFEPMMLPPTLLIFGAEQIAVPLVRLAKVLGFRTIVTDARPAFATPERHPDADQVLAAWPDQIVEQIGVDDRTYIISLNHEPRFEDAMLRALAHSPRVRYVGAIGKPVRVQERAERAAQAGFDLSQLPEIHTPIGLDIGGKSPEEIALSILAEIVAFKNGRAGGMLSAR